MELPGNKSQTSRGNKDTVGVLGRIPRKLAETDLSAKAEKLQITGEKKATSERKKLRGK